MSDKWGFHSTKMADGGTMLWHVEEHNGWAMTVIDDIQRPYREMEWISPTPPIVTETEMTMLRNMIHDVPRRDDERYKRFRHIASGAKDERG